MDHEVHVAATSRVRWQSRGIVPGLRRGRWGYNPDGLWHAVRGPSQSTLCGITVTGNLYEFTDCGWRVSQLGRRCPACTEADAVE